ncbi:MAG: hypothetical protein GYA55_06005 [SAR324 cluster bacterium]|uniref:histidine kinase n=1 Tax=SAR324 cluster bacterium TaxID=2024889 RepID=A0A7X9FQY7_9DELT|nr:hypothetical protein [SAR324 cluster bacterium]
MGIIEKNLSFRAIKLGIASFLLNFLMFSLSGASAIPLGNLLLFLAAGVLPFSAVVIAVATAALPLALYAPITSLGLLRVLIVCIAINFFAKRYPRLPSFIVGIVLWICIFWPAYFLSFQREVWDPHSIVLDGLTEIFFIIISGTLLLSPTIWWKLADQSRQIFSSSILIHLMASIAAISMVGVVVFSGYTSLPSSQLYMPTHLFGLTIFCIIIILFAAFLGSKLAHILDPIHDQQRATGMLSAQYGFSGLASGYWRRQMEEDARQNTEAISAKLESISGNISGTITNLPTQTVSPNTGICVFKRDGSVLFMNRKFRQYANINVSTVNGRTLKVLGVDPIICEHISNLIERTLTRGPEVTELKVNQLPDKLQFLQISSQKGEEATHATLGGGIDTVVITLEDITDRRTVESSLLKAQKLESLGSMVEQLALSFNNSLSIIAANASLASNFTDKSELVKALTEIAKTAIDSSNVTHQLIEFAQDRPVALIPVDLKTFITDRLPLLKSILQDNGDIICDISKEGVFCSIDEGLITQALSNVFLNAREAYNTGSGDVKLSLGTEEIEEEIARLHAGTRPGHFARIRIQDSGIGMTAETLSKAFDPLFTTKSSGGHAGLGLSTVFAIMRAHDGFLTAESHPGKGTIVSMYLPLQSEMASNTFEHLEKITSDAKVSDLPKGNGEKILLYEEDSELARVLTKICEFLGYSCIHAQENLDAFDNPHSSGISFAVIDRDSQKNDVRGIIDKLKNFELKTASIGSGAFYSNEKLGSENFLQKPFCVEAFAKLLDSSKG